MLEVVVGPLRSIRTGVAIFCKSGIARLTFPLPLEGSSRRRYRGTSTEESLAEESAWRWGCHLGAARAVGVLAVNQGRAALMTYAKQTAPHKEKFPSAISGRRGERFFEAKSRARQRGANS